MSVKKDFFNRFKYLTFSLILLAAIIGFHEKLIKSVLHIFLTSNHLCLDSKVQIQDFKIHSYAPNKFSIDTALAMDSDREELLSTHIKHARFEFNLVQVLRKFELPVNIYINGLFLDLQSNKDSTMATQLIKSLRKEARFSSKAS